MMSSNTFKIQNTENWKHLQSTVWKIILVCCHHWHLWKKKFI